MTLKFVGKTFPDLITTNPDMQLVNVYECDQCKARQIGQQDGCQYCKKLAREESLKIELNEGLTENADD